MFNLDKAIAHWLKGLSQRSGFRQEDLEELETHIRDYVEAEQLAGVSEKEAFQAGIRRFGDPEFVASEYQKTAWSKARTREGLFSAALAELSMVASYGQVGLRNLFRQRAYASINILGLAVGLACCLLIAMYVRFELSFDRHHEHADRIYRVAREWVDENRTPVLALARISMPIGPAMEKELPEVEKAVRLLQFDAPMAVDDLRFIEWDVFAADSGFFDVFTAPLLQGDARTALTSPNTVVVTEDMSKKYFGSADPMGRTLLIFDNLELTVTGVMASQPAASHFHPDFLVSFRTTEAWTSESDRGEWGQYNNYGTYILLSPSADAGVLQTKLPAFLRSHYRPRNNTEDALLLQPLTSIHLESSLDAEFEANGNRSYVILFVAVGFLILVIACFNFINLATARSAQRGKEVGMRKALGASRGRLIAQFLGESTILTLSALVAAIALMWLAMPEFSRLTGNRITFATLGIWDVAIGALSVVIVVSLLAGAYPAVFLSRFQPVAVLRRSVGGSWRSGIRSLLVVTQFAISIVLIIGMGVVLRQVSYVQNKDLGFEKDHLIVLPVAPEMQTDFERYRRQLASSPAIESVTASRLVPSRALVDHVGVQAEVNGEMRHASLALNPVDHDFLDVYGMELAAGRSFSKEIASDSTEAFIINEAAAELLGWKSADDAVDRRFIFEASGFMRPGSVIGVVRDFHFESLRNKIAPLVLFIMPERYSRVTVRIAPSRLDEAMAFLENRWADYRPDFPFTYSFVDQDFGALYEADRKVGRLFSYFAVIALIIAALGLFGLASFVADRRRKEIGVRKVLGASVSGIVKMLSLDFLRPVGMAFVVACPVAFLIVRWWLDRFAYRVDPDLWLFALAGVAVALVALATVSVQSIRTAVSDPVVSLKYE
ncbi:MAG TPA: ABC transporter permease [Rhodothermales bacterium]|nr:ABC transporter permease [Rhodothermales bacterium]